jgi:hypothetical protein
MSDGAATTEAGEAAAAAPPPDEVIASLEQRVRRLEEALAALQDTRQLEERVVERITRAAPAAQPVATPAAPAPAPAPDSANLLLDAGKRLLPSAVGVFQAEAHAADAQVRAGGPTTRPAWFLVDAYAEVRAMVHMYVDRRYRMTWVGRVVPWVLLAALLTSWIWFPGLSTAFNISQFLGLMLMKPVDLVLAFFFFRILSREARRYRETAPALPAHLRA